MSAASLDTLNPDQRRAVVHGAGDAAPGPLLIIAGAGSGKTNTLAHRVAHLVVNGADPGRILLMTFSRRAANEMTKRVERIVARALPATSAPPTLAWSGTFHGIGARLLREYAGAIGLDPAFTIHDREDSADLMNLVAPRTGPVAHREALPHQGDVPGDLFAHGQPGGRTRRRCCTQSFPWCAGWQDGAHRAVRAPMWRPSRARTCSITTTCCSISRQCWRSGPSPRISARASTISWSTNIRTPTGCRPRSSWR